MSDTKKKRFEALIPELQEMINDPCLHEFRPVLNEMLIGCKTPEYDNTNDVIEEFHNNNCDYTYRKLADALFVHSAMFQDRKKWYQL